MQDEFSEKTEVRDFIIDQIMTLDEIEEEKQAPHQSIIHHKKSIISSLIPSVNSHNSQLIDN